MRSPPLWRKTTCKRHDLVQSGKSSMMSWPDVKLIPQTNNPTCSSKSASCCSFHISSSMAALYSRVCRGEVVTVCCPPPPAACVVLSDELVGRALEESVGPGTASCPQSSRLMTSSSSATRFGEFLGGINTWCCHGRYSMVFRLSQ